MIKKYLIFVTVIISLNFASENYVKEYKIKPSKTEFEFDISIAIEYAKLGIIELDRNLGGKILSPNSILINPHTIASLYSTDCNEDTIKVVYVSFKTGKDNYVEACLKWDKDGYFDSILHRGGTIKSPKESIINIKDPNRTDIWGCGI